MARNNLDIYENILILIVGWHSLLLCTQKYLQKTLNEIIMRQKTFCGRCAFLRQRYQSLIKSSHIVKLDKYFKQTKARAQN